MMSCLCKCLYRTSYSVIQGLVFTMTCVLGFSAVRILESVIRNPKGRIHRDVLYSVVVCEQMSKLNFIHTCIYLSTLYGNKTNVFVILKTWQRAVGAVNAKMRRCEDAKMLDELQGDTII